MPEKPPPLRRRPMAAGSWVRSFQCRSTAAEDVATTVAAPLPKKSHLLLRSSCASSGDIHHRNNVASCKPKPKPSPKPSQETSKKKPKGNSNRPASSVLPSPSPPPPPGTLGPLPALTELPAGHSSRQVVEIIFLSSWSSPLPPAPPAAFAGEVEMLFRVHNQARAVARFEDYRAAVRARARDARIAADGNEMMRFSPAPAHGCSSSEGAAALRVVRTFDGSGGAHASGRGSGPESSGRRAMFLCRVIAGRVAEGEDQSGKDEYDSVRSGKGELVVFDRRAVLPCFLIIYKL